MSPRSHTRTHSRAARSRNANVPGIFETAVIFLALHISWRYGFPGTNLPLYSKRWRLESKLNGSSNLTKSSFPLGKLKPAN